MKRRTVIVVLLIIMGLISPSNALCEGMSNEEIIKELRALKERITKLEVELAKKDQEIERLKAETVKREEVSEVVEEMKSEGGPLARIQDHIQISGLIEFGGARENVDNRDGTDASQSDMNLTTVELTVAAEVSEWVNLAVTLLYEDATFGNETSIDLDAATVTIGNTEKYPLYFSAGAMYVPFGALLTHFPDDPLIDLPLTLLLGETREKAALMGIEYQGFSISGYVFNGDLDETGGENHVENFGFDAHWDHSNDRGLEITAGASYISNIADSDTLTDELQNNLGVNTIEDYVGGFDVYMHFGFTNFFFDAEYMTATENFQPNELLAAGVDGARPSVWNLEAGYNWNWGKNLEIAFKYAGSNETESLGWPEKRYGIAFNQEIFDSVTGSLALLHDKFDENDTDGRDDRDVVFGQIAVEF